jgi:hypothetical protein
LLDIWRGRFSERGMQGPLLSDSYLKELIAAFPQDMTVYSVNIEGKLATATACCAMQKERYGYWIGNVNARKDLSVTDYLIWEVVRRAKSEGFKRLDLGATFPRPSRFKSKFDPVLEPYWEVEKADMLYKSARFAYSKLGGARLRVKQILRRRAKHESSSPQARAAIAQAADAAANAGA